MILSSKRLTKTLISLRGCVRWSAPLSFANTQRQVLSRRAPLIKIIVLAWPLRISGDITWDTNCYAVYVTLARLSHERCSLVLFELTYISDVFVMPK